METPTTRRLYYIGLIVGEMGALGQALLLHHELIDTLPYKAMSVELFFTYMAIARTGVWSAFILSVLIGAYLGRYRVWLTVLVPVILSPIVFGLVYKAYSMLYLMEPASSYGEFGTEAAAGQFYQYCFSLVCGGILVGTPLCAIMYFIQKKITKITG
jgi:hypothetical protein